MPTNRIVVHPDPRRKRVQLQVECPGAQRVLLEIPEAGLRSEGGPGSHSLVFNEFTPWTPSTPLLYTLRYSADGSPGSELRFGMREVSVQDRRFTINQRPVMLRGVRNSAHGLPTKEAIRAYLDSLRAHGFTWLRCAAGDDRLDELLDAADAAGLLISIRVASADDFVALTQRYHHHPSLAFWEIMNPKFAAAMREHDPVRPIVAPADSSGTLCIYRPFQPEAEALAPVGIETFSPVSREAESYCGRLGHASAMNLVTVRGFADGNGELSQHLADGLRLIAEHLRANPRVAGYCFEDALAGGAGARGPQLAAAREAQAAVRPVITLARTNLEPREEVDVSVLLLNEAKLEGRAEMSLQVVGPTNQTLWKKKRGVKIPKHGKELWVGSVAASGSIGPHKFVVQIWTDKGLAGEGSAGFHVSPPVESWKGAIDVLDPSTRWLETVRKLAPHIEATAQVILVPPLARSVRAYPDNLFGQALGRVREGAAAIVFDPPADWRDLGPTLSAPLEAATEPLLEHSGGCVLARLHPVFEGLPAGGPMGRPYRGVLTQRYIAGESEDDIAPVTGAGVGLSPGAAVCVRRFGSGRVIFTTLRLLDRIGADPVADRLFVNLLSYSERRALPYAGIARAEMKTVEWLRAERGKLRAWRVIGPFANPDGTGHAAAYPPESGFEPEAAYAGSFRAVSWSTWHQGPERLDELDLAVVLAPNTFRAEPMAGTYYAYAEITGEARTEPVVSLRHTGLAKLWINGRLAYGSSPAAQGDPGGEYTGGVVLKQGRNTVLAKVSVMAAKPWFALDVRSGGGSLQLR